jgi:uncharacterized protein involved in copper resistance
MEAPGEPKLRKRLIMKKLLAVLALSALAACGGGDEAAQEPATDATVTEGAMPATDPAATTPMPPATTMPMDSTGAAGTTAPAMDSAGGNTTPEGAETTTP